MASEQQNADALKYHVEPGKAAVYIYRQRGLVGGGDVYPVYLDGRFLGNNGPDTFLIATVSSGPHVISAGVSQAMLTVTSGGTYFVRQTGSVSMSSQNITTVRVVSSEEGKNGVSACKRAVTNF